MLPPEVLLNTDTLAVVPSDVAGHHLIVGLRQNAFWRQRSNSRVFGRCWCMSRYNEQSFDRHFSVNLFILQKRPFAGCVLQTEFTILDSGSGVVASWGHHFIDDPSRNFRLVNDVHRTCRVVLVCGTPSVRSID